MSPFIHSLLLSSMFLHGQAIVPAAPKSGESHAGQERPPWTCQALSRDGLSMVATRGQREWFIARFAGGDGPFREHRDTLQAILDDYGREVETIDAELQSAAGRTPSGVKTLAVRLEGRTRQLLADLTALGAGNGSALSVPPTETFECYLQHGLGRWGGASLDLSVDAAPPLIFEEMMAGPAGATIAKAAEDSPAAAECTKVLLEASRSIHALDARSREARRVRLLDSPAAGGTTERSATTAELDRTDRLRRLDLLLEGMDRVSQALEPVAGRGASLEWQATTLYAILDGFAPPARIHPALMGAEREMESRRAVAALRALVGAVRRWRSTTPPASVMTDPLPNGLRKAWSEVLESHGMAPRVAGSAAGPRDDCFWTLAVNWGSEPVERPGPSP